MSTTKQAPAAKAVPAAPEPEKLIRVTILRNTLSNGRYGGRKGDVIELPEKLGQSWIDAKFVELVPAK